MDRLGTCLEGKLVSGPAVDMGRASLSNSTSHNSVDEASIQKTFSLAAELASPFSSWSFGLEGTYLFSFSSSATSKSSLQPTSIRTFMPPSNSSRDCEASELECDPSNGVKLNILTRSCPFELHHDVGSNLAY